MSTSSYDQIWSFSSYEPAPIPHDTFLPLRAVATQPEVASVTQWIEMAEHENDEPSSVVSFELAAPETSVYDGLRPDVLEDERIPETYGQDMTGWYVLREILDDLRNERVLI